MNENYYELRHIETSVKESPSFSVSEDVEDRFTLLDVLNNFDRVLLLGNPGAGKTTELKRLFTVLWEEKTKTKQVPFYINIKNFRQTTKIEELINTEEWKLMPSVVFIFDGLDEIGNIPDFVADLESFIAKYTNLNLKFVISCRTNIYQKYLIDISGFVTAYLKNLSHYQVHTIFKNKYDLQIPYNDIHLFYTILQTPFNLDLFANYYTKNSRFPETVERSWQLFTEMEIEKAHKMLIRRIIVTKAEIYNALQEVAVTNELMQQNAIEEGHLFKLLGEKGISIFQELPFIEKYYSSNTYFFRHKNYQEYFAAKYISSLKTDEIIQFIKADGIEKIKPNLFNTATFLLNILEDDKFKVLKNWLLNHDLEILFFADDNRLSPQFRNEIFEQFFKDNCMDKTFWISNGKIPINILAKFADFTFLMKVINEAAQNHRVRSSALQVIAQKVLNDEQKTILKKDLLSHLPKSNDSFIAEILRTIKIQNFHKSDANFWDAVLPLVKETKSRDVSHQIISVLSSLNDERRDSTILLSVVRNHFRTIDNVIRGTENLLGSILLTTNNKDLHLSLLNLFLDESLPIRLSDIYLDQFDKQLVKKVKDFTFDTEYAKNLLEITFSGQYRIMSNELLQKIIAEITITPALLTHVLQRKNMSTDVLYLVSGLLNKELIDSIVEGYKEGTLNFREPKDIETLRNWVASNNLDLAIYLESEFSEASFVFSELLPREEDRQSAIKKYEEFQLFNFNLLFDRKKIQTEIVKYFEKHKIHELDSSHYRKLYMDWYSELGYHGLRYTVHAVLERAFREETILKTENITKLLEDPFFYLSVLKGSLPQGSSKKIQLEEDHIAVLESITKSVAERINFANVIKKDHDNPDSFRTTKYFNYLKIVLFFDLSYNIRLDKDFYLNALEFANVTSHSYQEGPSFIDHVLKRINDEEAVNKRIVENINKGNLIFQAKHDHFLYAIEHNLKDSFNKIGEEIVADETLSHFATILEKYVAKLENPLPFLKAVCTDPTRFSYWQAIRTIKEMDLDRDFILQAARNYLENTDTKFVYDAINILFFLNQQDALHYYHKLLIQVISTKTDHSGWLPKDITNYNNINEIFLYEELFNSIFGEASPDAFYLHHSRQFMISLTAILSATDAGYDTLRVKLLELKTRVDSDHKRYYINYLIDTADISYLKAKSHKLSFEDAATLIKE